MTRCLVCEVEGQLWVLSWRISCYTFRRVETTAVFGHELFHSIRARAPVLRSPLSPIFKQAGATVRLGTATAKMQASFEGSTEMIYSSPHDQLLINHPKIGKNLLGQSWSQPGPLLAL